MEYLRRRRQGRSLPVEYFLLAFLIVDACAPVGKGPAPEPGVRRAVLEDQSFTVEAVPAGSPAHRAASFRLAAEGYRALLDGRYREAEDRLEKALSVDPRNPFCYLYLADIRVQEADCRQAMILLNQAEVLFQGHRYWLGEVYTRKGLCWESLDSAEQARSAYTKALEYNPWNEESRNRIR